MYIPVYIQYVYIYSGYRSNTTCYIHTVIGVCVPVHTGIHDVHVHWVLCTYVYVHVQSDACTRFSRESFTVISFVEKDAYSELTFDLFRMDRK